MMKREDAARMMPKARGRIARAAPEKREVVPPAPKNPAGMPTAPKLPVGASRKLRGMSGR